MPSHCNFAVVVYKHIPKAMKQDGSQVAINPRVLPLPLGVVNTFSLRTDDLNNDLEHQRPGCILAVHVRLRNQLWVQTGGGRWDVEQCRQLIDELCSIR